MTPAEDHVDLRMLDVINTAFIAGYDVGYAHGRNARRAEAEAVRLHDAASDVVLRCAGLPEVDPAEGARRLALRESRWSS